MITPKDIELTDKMLAEVSRVQPYRCTTSWTAYDEPQKDACWRCGLCHGLLVLGQVPPTDGRVAQHLVTDHGFTYDGLTPEELKEMIK